MKNGITKLLACAVISIKVNVLLSADPLVTDRPDATESSSVIAPHYMQLEGGIIAFKDADGVEGQEYGGSLLRVGVVENWELRLGWGGYADTQMASGATDGLLGFKYLITAEDRDAWLPELALLVHTTVPVGDDAFTSDQWDPSFLFSFSHTLNDRWSLGYNLGAQLVTSEKANGDEATLASGLYSIALGYGATEQLGFFIEMFGDVALSAETSSASLDGGVTWLFSDDHQFDFFAGVGMDPDADDWFFGMGYSIRFGY